MKGFVFIQVLLISGMFVVASSAGSTCRIPDNVGNLHSRLKDRYLVLMDDINKAKVIVKQDDITSCTLVIEKLVLVNYNNSISRIRALNLDAERFAERLAGFCKGCPPETCAGYFNDIYSWINKLKETRREITELYTKETVEGLQAMLSSTDIKTKTMALIYMAAANSFG